MSKYVISVVDNIYLLKNIEIIKKQLAIAFKDAKFNSNYSESSPFEEVFENCVQRPKCGVRHVIAHDTNQQMIGAFFAISTVSTPVNLDADGGWFFTIPSLQCEMRKKVAFDLIDTGHNIMREGGFLRSVSMMGTKAGEKFFSEHFGYIHEPIESENNRWIYNLT